MVFWGESVCGRGDENGPTYTEEDEASRDSYRRSFVFVTAFMEYILAISIQLPHMNFKNHNSRLFPRTCRWPRTSHEASAEFCTPQNISPAQRSVQRCKQGTENEQATRSNAPIFS